LSWLSLWLGFHLTGVFIHNDSSSALASPASQLVFTPTAGALVQAAACRANPAASALFRHLSPTDFIAHHAIALGLHTTSFVLVKGGVDSHGSRFLPDKAEHGFAFACDGPGRGGSCDSSSWDAVYLACFWLLNTLAWALFYVHWLSLPQRAAEALSLLAWFRDYLWFFSAHVVRGYGALGPSELAPYSWAFLLAHLTWATGFMFLISWRGYWQELVEILSFMHLAAPVVSSTWAGRVTPSALSIVQARCVGLAHFSAGFVGAYYCFLSSVL
jgi:photosystem I P700 chlorophyll a apoprotein A2